MVSAMGEDEPKKQSDGGDEAREQIAVPSHSPLPPPPEVNFSRPTLKSATPGKPWDRADIAPRRPGSPPVENASVSLGAGMAAGSVFVASVVVGVGVGQWIDRHWIHAAIPWGTIVFVLAGVAAGFLNLLRIVSPRGKHGNK